MVREAYMKIFPTVKEFSSPINVCVVGPYPASLERVDDPNDLAAQMQQQAAINTSEVLKAAQDGALDSSLAKVAELLDDLDVRHASKVGEGVLSINPKRRGTWQYIHSHLQLASKHCPSLSGITSLLHDLIRVGETMRDAPKGIERMNAFRRYSEIRQEIRDEATAIVKGKDSSKGFEALQMSLTLSNSYETLLQQFQTANPSMISKRLKRKSKLRQVFTSTAPSIFHRCLTRLRNFWLVLPSWTQLLRSLRKPKSSRQKTATFERLYQSGAIVIYKNQNANFSDHGQLYLHFSSKLSSKSQQHIS